MLARVSFAPPWADSERSSTGMMAFVESYASAEYVPGAGKCAERS